jgi:ribosomal-protein-alanine N-acetyltransferase
MTVKIMNITKLSISDLEELTTLHQKCFDEKVDRNYFLQEFKNPVSKIIGIKSENKIIGYLNYWIIKDEIEIIKIGVDPNFRRRGYGLKLLNQLISHESFSKIYLEVSDQNQPAILFYQKIGFIKVGVRAKYYKNNNDAVLMEYELTS